VVINAEGAIVGYTAGNDVSSRSIEGENPLYLPQAKVYDGSCAIGPGIVVAGPDAQRDLPIHLSITRGGERVFQGATATSQLKRSVEEIAGWLIREMMFPQGAVLLTGTCLVPEDDFTLKPGDRVRVQVGDLVLENPVT
jgi:2-dehydro-3-deoxy-D-arabinonate dehydratase